MPYIKQNKPFDKLQRLIRGYANTTEVAAKLECSAPTARSRVNDPGTLTLYELKKLSQRLHIPIEELREAITW